MNFIFLLLSLLFLTPLAASETESDFSASESASGETGSGGSDEGSEAGEEDDEENDSCNIEVDNHSPHPVNVTIRVVDGHGAPPIVHFNELMEPANGANAEPTEFMLADCTPIIYSISAEQIINDVAQAPVIVVVNHLLHTVDDIDTITVNADGSLNVTWL